MTQTLNLIEQLKQIPDYRKSKGKRHALWLVMILVLQSFIVLEQTSQPYTNSIFR